MEKRLSLFLVVGVLSSLPFCDGCGGSNASNSPTPPPPSPITVSITPSATNLLVGARTRFIATLTGTLNFGVTYSVTQGAAGGQVLNTGEYTAPINPGTYTVRVTSAADPTKFAEASVTVHDYTKFDRAPALAEGYDYHTASLLPDGSVLIVGGWATSDGNVHKQALRYIPTEDRFVLDSTLETAREGHAAAPLPDGSPLITGGWDRRAPGTAFDPVYQSTEFYSADWQMFVGGPDMNFPRRHHVATQMKDYRVLITGGIQLRGSGFGASTNAEIYDPTLYHFLSTGHMNVGRWLHTATLLNDGRVLLVGGRDNNCTGTCPVYSLSSAELYDPVTEAFTPTGPLNISRFGHTATLLQDGRVLILGGESTDEDNLGMLTAAEVYDPATGQFTKWGQIAEGRSHHTVTLLNNGKLLVAGGFRVTSIATNKTEIFDPLTGTSQPGPDMMEFHARHTATKLPNGEVLIFSGTYGTDPINVAEIFH